MPLSGGGNRSLNSGENSEDLLQKRIFLQNEPLRCDTWYLDSSDLFAMYVLTWWMLDSN